MDFYFLRMVDKKYFNQPYSVRPSILADLNELNLLPQYIQRFNIPEDEQIFIQELSTQTRKQNLMNQLKIQTKQCYFPNKLWDMFIPDETVAHAEKHVFLSVLDRFKENPKALELIQKVRRHFNNRRTKKKRSVRDLLGLEVDSSCLLPVITDCWSHASSPEKFPSLKFCQTETDTLPIN